MIGQLLAKVIGTQNEREIKRLRPLVAEISALEPTVQKLTDEQLREKTVEFRKRVADGASLDDPSSRCLPWCARRASAYSTCATSTCS
jgi:preprotein translocase subunit SecA